MSPHRSLLGALLTASLGLAPLAHAAPNSPLFSRVSKADLPARPEASQAPRMIDGQRRVRWLAVEGQMPFATRAKKRAAVVDPAGPTGPWGGKLPENDALTARSAPQGEFDLEESLGRKPPPPPSKNAPAPLFQEVSLQPRGPGCLRVPQPNREQFGQPQLTISYAEGVVPIQFERLVYTADGARLEMAQLWLDARTLGVQPISARRVPLTRLLPTQQGIDVWGVREHGGLRVLMALSPAAVGSQKGQYNSQPCSFVHMHVQDTPDGHQNAVSFTPYLWKQAAAGQPELTTIPQPFIVTASLSRLSRDPEPLLSVGLRQDSPPPMPPVAMPIEE